MPDTGFITLGKQQIHYLQYGNGTKLVIAFHGFADDATLFEPVANLLRAECTIVSIDLPYHGDTVWQDDVPLMKKDLETLARTLMQLFSVPKFSLLGYSIGGKLCLSIAEMMPECIDNITLVAADGLATNFYYRFLTRTVLGKIVFMHLTRKPGGYFKLLDLLKRTRLITSYTYKFVKQNLNSVEKRNKVRAVWMCLRYLDPRQNVLKKVIQDHCIPVSIFMGRYDHVIPLKTAEQFKKGKATVHLQILEKGHRLMDGDTIQMIAERLL